MDTVIVIFLPKIGVTALISAPQSVFLWSPLLLSEVLTNDQNLIEAIDFCHTFAVKIVLKKCVKFIHNSSSCYLLLGLIHSKNRKINQIIISS